MAKLSSVQKNLFRKKLIKKYKSKRESLKAKIKDKNISLDERILFQNKLNDLPRNGSSIRHRNRCEITGRPRGNYRKFGLSRIKLRELSMTGDLPGVVKSSWQEDIMAFNDSLSDMLARIKNAHQANKVSTLCLKSKLNINVLSVLKDEGYIRDFKNLINWNCLLP